ncbi:MAG TPA: ribosome maturation factor RimP [Gemmatimonadetes bacterium]|nr:ribosome maturation factor RimP [Gemmatimonadota bacterium]
MGELFAPAFLFAVTGEMGFPGGSGAMARSVPEVDRGLPFRIEQLGYELVDVEWAGSGRRPILRVRIDRPGDGAGEGIVVGDCARVSRALEPWLDQVGSMPERHVLEVSSPGVERPLVRSRDFKRFAGKKIAVKGSALLAGRATRLEGELLGLVCGDEGGERVCLRLPDGDEVEIPRSEIAGVHLVFEW